WTMSGISSLAFSAPSASRVDLTDHPLTNQIGIVGLNDDSYKFVTWDPGEARVSACDFEVSVANAGIAHANKRFTLNTGHRRIVDHFQLPIEPQRSHTEPSANECQGYRSNTTSDRALDSDLNLHSWLDQLFELPARGKKMFLRGAVRQQDEC